METLETIDCRFMEQVYPISGLAGPLVRWQKVNDRSL